MADKGTWPWNLPEVTPEQLLQEYHSHRDKQPILYNEAIDKNYSAEQLPHNFTRVVEGDMIPVTNHAAQQLAKRCADLYDKFVASSRHHHKCEDTEEGPAMNNNADAEATTSNDDENIDSNIASSQILHITTSDFIEFTTLFHNLSCLNQASHAGHSCLNGHHDQRQLHTQHDIAPSSRDTNLPFLHHETFPEEAYQTRSPLAQDEPDAPLYNKDLLRAQQPVAAAAAAAEVQKQGIEHGGLQHQQHQQQQPSPSHAMATDTTTSTTAAAAALEAVLARVRAIRRAVEGGSAAAAREGLRWLEGEVERMLEGCAAGRGDGTTSEDENRSGGHLDPRARVAGQQDDAELELDAWLDLSRFS
ncbi:hypothetical protein MYCTH_2128726 [Thermothelomyces thermophilus ATCC 42464]|uniref:Uncharacterized protein n=1 Tax=Thermothelomyces thermophilus (strain ATCC 42464 / BCRC 31852 / DSM 1799) TaxID=573729 RepID=G2QJ69_THET4|nr:uncharacterized protein MYCTH_2128726 [Thermothelomyces thermophilus ATCC 42464]AEO59644.1 hypothetical protein MYCTH_2128726 [Thermothelomyces thermophilus ATCC 42464]